MPFLLWTALPLLLPLLLPTALPFLLPLLLKLPPPLPFAAGCPCCRLLFGSYTDIGAHVQNSLLFVPGDTPISDVAPTGVRN